MSTIRYKTVERIIDRSMTKQAFGEAVGSLAQGFGDLTKAVTYVVAAIAAAGGAGAGVLWDKATEPTDTDIGNAQKAYAIANMQANIDGQRRKLIEERRDIKPPKKSMRILS